MIPVHVVVERNTRNAMVRTPKLILPFSLVIFMMTLYSSVFSQDSGKVSFNMDYDILSRYRAYKHNLDSTKIEGYRIQIFYGNDMYEAKKVAYEFKTKFNGLSTQVEIRYDQPAWKVRVGNFYREVDAQRYLKTIRETYPGAFLVKTHISAAPLVRTEE